MPELIQLQELPRDIINKIPMSLRINKTELDISNLSPYLRYLLIPFVEVKEEYQSQKLIYDLIPNISVYSDLETINTKKKLVVEYLKNFILTSKKSYPFDPEAGSILKELLQTKNDSIKKTLFSNELSRIVNEIKSIFSIPVVINSYNLNEVDYGVYAGYTLAIDMTIEEEPIQISFQV
jgi:hypothetical protein